MAHVAAVREAFGYLYAGEVALLQRLASHLPDDSIIVNIGAGAGTSALAFVESRADVTVYTIDKQADSSPYGSLEGERNAFAAAGLTYLFNHAWFQIHGDSKQVGERWLREGRPVVDLVFVDGDHTEAGCAGDIEAWLPNLATGGIIAIHDYRKAENDPTANGRSKPYPGVDAAVDRLLAGWPIVGQADTTIAFRKEASREVNNV